MVIFMPRTQLFGTLSLKTFWKENVKSRNMPFIITNYGVNMSCFEAVVMVNFKYLSRYNYYRLIRVNFIYLTMLLNV